MGTVPIAISAFTPLNRPFPGAKLDVPRLGAPRGPARGRARANRPSLSYRMFESHIGARRACTMEATAVGSCVLLHENTQFQC